LKLIIKISLYQIVLFKLWFVLGNGDDLLKSKMFTLDMRTALLSFILISVISIIFIIVFLQQFRNRNKGGICIILSFFVQTIGLLLVLLRGHVSMWLSFDVSNTLTVAGLVLLFKGLEARKNRVPLFRIYCFC